ncbi:MAG: hypothetical protein JKY81_01620 [Colwellia sp.]|nr:hypothetical protein [Colwellia sp.]
MSKQSAEQIRLMVNTKELERIMPSAITYRDHEITISFRVLAPNFEYAHKDYDGIGNDERHGAEDTIQECKEAIDEWHIEQGENDD